MKIAREIRKQIEGIPEGQPFTSAAFLGHGTRSTVDQALCRLVRGKAIERLARGIFVRPKVNRYVGKVSPEPMKVAEAIAQATGATIQVHGAEAARRLELTTQVPTQPFFYSSGPSKRFHMGKLEVRLKHVSPRKLALAGRPAGLAISALWYLGKREVTASTIETIRRKLPASEFEALKTATSHMPTWMANAIMRHERAASRG